ncbi:MAG TPA: DUF433 domain-containing protein [Armatimonadetes bacterium]|nr:DUF433 domain-containing protein [Armatimonadota bacterium]
MISALVLAAGESRRMGTPKQLLPFGASTVLQAVVDALAAAGVEEIIVVLGHRAEEIAPTLAERPVEIVVNENYRKGMLSSVQCGLRAVSPEAEAVLVALGDQPRLSPETVRQLISAYRIHSPGLAVPVYRGRRGHPLLLRAKYRDEVFHLNPEIGLRELLHRHPEEVLLVAVESDEVLPDLDDPVAYQRALAAQASEVPRLGEAEVTIVDLLHDLRAGDCTCFGLAAEYGVSEEVVVEALQHALDVFDLVYRHPEPFDLPAYVRRTRDLPEEQQKWWARQEAAGYDERGLAYGTEWLTEVITRHPKVQTGQPCFKGFRIDVETALRELTFGQTLRRIVKGEWLMPLTLSDLQEALDLVIDAVERHYRHLGPPPPGRVDTEAKLVPFDPEEHLLRFSENYTGPHPHLDDVCLVQHLREHGPVAFVTHNFRCWYHPDLADPRYAILCLALSRRQAAMAMKRLYSRPEFDSDEKCMGRVICLWRERVTYYQLGDPTERTLELPITLRQGTRDKEAL